MADDTKSEKEALSHPATARALTSQAAVMPRADASVVRQGYSTSEVHALYSLCRVFLTSGNVGSAHRIAKGLVAVAPEFTPAWLAMSYISLMKEDYNESIFSARQALRVEPTSIEALLFLVIAYFQAEDYQTGGTYLGEVADLVRSESVNPELKRLYDSQVIRFEDRLKMRKGRD